ncbi:contractile injection system protein, VgrG/Pvc8 family [Cupriavidus neocaledonicus]|uniref:contractile injection system protein, VgrG/Pvc8 family n=1 Tax=Cupriavidus neocaledonicus TaxID=1040979 RepID=UPI00036C7497|nr:contractile injection system protein, VgrG/Pvc8 family [Cupriavidus neocaledonicus]
MRPDFRLVANSTDITATILDRLVSLRFTDEAGMASDMLEIVLADHDPLAPIQVPSAGAELELFLGYDGATQRMGLFVFDELELAGDPGEMVIRARAAPYDASKGGKVNLQSQKTRSWPKGTKLSAMVAKIAKEHGLEPAVAASLQAIPLPHIDQADESDLNLLVRIAKKYDAVVKPAGGKLVLAKRGEAKTVGGADLPTITLLPTDRTSWRMVQSKRETAGMVVAYWHAVKQAKRHEVKVGKGEPVRRLRQYYPTQEMALAAARAELSRRERGKVTLSVTLPGRTDLAAEAKLILSGWRPGIPTDWIISRVEHSLDAGGYRCTLEAEQPDSGATPAVEDVAE